MRAMTHLVNMGSSIDSRNFTRVGCVGAGVMGHSWAALFAVKGYQVALQDISEANLERAMEWIQTALDLMAEKTVIQLSEVEPALSRVHPTTDLGEAVGEADFVLESVYEDYGAKREIFKEMDAHAPEESILATGSSRLLITEIQKATERPERCIGAHGFNPPHLVPLVEIVPGEATSPETVEGTRALMEGLGKIPITVRKEVAGYLGNRIQSAVHQAARDLVESGIATVEEVDLAVSTGIGLRWALYGPFAVTYFNTPSHLIDHYGLSGLVAEGLQEHSLMKGKTFDEMVRWRNGKLIDMLRVLEHID
jgi:3-hydroxypropionate dehydrogenase (NADP+)